jgi:hypothetical protein
MDKAAIKLGGAKRKNGHKMNCDCHICENMKNKAKRGGYAKDVEKEELNQMGGSKKKNGHKPDCDCPICKNMINAKKSMKSGKGGKKNNGHKMNCGCPICKNMSKKSRKGGFDPNQAKAEEEASDDEYDNLDEINTATSTDATGNQLSSMTATEDEMNELENSNPYQEKNGGRKRKTMRKSMKKSMKKRGNGHKANCGCPICKNMRKGSKTRRR